VAVTPLQQDVERLMDALITATGDVERRLEEGGEQSAHDWMFALREILYDVKRALLLVARLPGEEGADAVRRTVEQISTEFVYMLGPHAEHHLGELLEAFEREHPR
jgi:hypothetical protein